MSDYITTEYKGNRVSLFDRFGRFGVKSKAVREVHKLQKHTGCTVTLDQHRFMALNIYVSVFKMKSEVGVA